jgi:hypothetical protein
MTTNSFQSEYDRHRQTLIAQDEEGWAAELRRYLGNIPVDITKETDIVEWWQVRISILLDPLHLNRRRPG